MVFDRQPASYLSFLNRFSQAGAFLVVFIGVAVLLGWTLHVALLESVLPGLVTMKVNTACGFVAAGVTLWLLQTAAPGSRSVRLARALAVIVAALGGLSLAEDLFHVDLGIDQLLLRDVSQAAHTLNPGRMAPTTAVCFLLIGLALLAFKSRPARPLIARAYWLVVAPLFVSTVVLVGYAYDVRSLYRVGPYVSMAAHTALCFFVLSLSVLAGNPARGIAGVFASETAGGVVARRLLPTLPVILFVLGWLRLAGQDAGLYDTRFGVALIVVLSITVCVAAVGSTAVRLHAIDTKRRNAEAEILALNAGLERRVQERTQELEDSMAQVKQLGGMLPICAWCKKIRDDKDYWQSVEGYVADRTNARFTHSICPECSAKVMPPEVIAMEADTPEGGQVGSGHDAGSRRSHHDIT